MEYLAGRRKDGGDSLDTTGAPRGTTLATGTNIRKRSPLYDDRSEGRFNIAGTRSSGSFFELRATADIIGESQCTANRSNSFAERERNQALAVRRGMVRLVEHDKNSSEESS